MNWGLWQYSWQQANKLKLYTEELYKESERGDGTRIVHRRSKMIYNRGRRGSRLIKDSEGVSFDKKMDISDCDYAMGSTGLQCNRPEMTLWG